MIRSGLLIALLFTISGIPQIYASGGFKLTGSIQSDILLPQTDSLIGAADYPEFALTNTYADLHLVSKKIQAGLRFEYLKHPLPGFEKEFNGVGFPNIFLAGNFSKYQFQIGDFYEQFGSGLILRLYEERSLGIDNSLRGMKFSAQPVKGLQVKVLGGRQRHFFDWNKGLVWGADAELSFDQLFKKLEENNAYWSVGASFVSRHETGDTILINPRYRLNMPDNTGAFSFRTRFQKDNITLNAEYAYKFNDPSKDNGYIYKPGNVLLLSGSWSKKGMSLLLQAKRSDNMSFRSDRNLTGLSSFINHLPPFTMQQAYTLPALYPYATQPDGEWAFQAEAGYLFPRKTVLGGKYGTKLKINFSHVRSLPKTFVSEDPAELMGTMGYTLDSWGWGNELYYQDLNVTIEKKISQDVKLNFMYMNQYFNQVVIQSHGEIIRSDIFVGEGSFKLNDKLTLRSELQYLHTGNDEGDWIFGLAELTVLPNIMVSVSDEFNAGSSKLHYYMASASYIMDNHRFMIGYGRTRAGYNCAGGVCRNVPASKGLSISYSYNF